MTRIRVVGGPWPERIGCEGVLVPDPGDGMYPFDKRHRTQVVILLDDDPVGHKLTVECNPRFCSHPSAWTCVMDRNELVVLG